MSDAYPAQLTEQSWVLGIPLFNLYFIRGKKESFNIGRNWYLIHLIASASDIRGR